MQLSVVTACYNSEATIGDTIESFLTQSHREKEMIVIDGMSSDGTLDVINSFRSLNIRVISERDCGVYDAMNKGLSQFKGDAVGFLNSDDTFHDSQALSLIAEALDQADLVYGDLLMVSDHKSKTIIREWIAGAYGPRAFQRGWQPPHPGFFARRSAVEMTGPFDLSYLTASDYDWMLRALLIEDIRVAYVPRVLVDFQMGGLSTRDWRATLRGTQEALRSRRQHLKAPPIDVAIILRLWRRLLQLRSLRKYYRQS